MRLANSWAMLAGSSSTGRDASQPSQQGYRLTEDNYLSIDPMIGLTEEEIQHFFKN